MLKCHITCAMLTMLPPGTPGQHPCGTGGKRSQVVSESVPPIIVIPGTKQCSTHTHHVSPLFHGNRIITGHTHGKEIDILTLPFQLAKIIVTLPEHRMQYSLIRCIGRDDHNTSHPDMGKRIQQRQYSLIVFRQKTGLLRFPSHIDLQQHIHDFALLRCFLFQRPQQMLCFALLVCR